MKVTHQPDQEKCLASADLEVPYYRCPENGVVNVRYGDILNVELKRLRRIFPNIHKKHYT